MKKVCKLWLFVMIFSIVCVLRVQAKDRNTVILNADVQSPTEGCTMVGVQGSYAGDVDAAVKRLNEIRLEACKNGYPDPRNPFRKLTEGDYVPLKWSSDLEYIARIRAAEASIYPMHARPNGKSWSSIETPNGIGASNEVLAWQSWTGTLVDAINNWYREKEAWVKRSGGVTGHYTSMINPNARYGGVATFNSNTGAWHCSSAGNFSSADNLDTTQGSAINNCLQIIEVKNEYLGETVLDYESGNDDEMECFLPGVPEKTLKIGDVRKYDLLRKTVIDDAVSYVYDLGNITWSSSDSDVAIVDEYGKVTLTGYGTVTITAVSDGGLSASAAIDVKTDIKEPAISKLTAAKKGFTVKWSKKSGNGYEIQYSTNKNFKKNVKVKVIAKKNTTKLTVNKLKSKKKYYVRIRTIKKIKNNSYYSDWSDIKYIKTK